MASPNLQAALEELESRRKRLQEEFQAVDQAISGIRSLLAKDASLLAQVPQEIAPLTLLPARRYAGMSVRWGVLQYLAEDSQGPATTAEIASALLAGGMTTSGRDFVSNVSAVISTMVNKRAELEAIQGRYHLTMTGVSAWGSIKMTHQYRSRSSLLSPSVQ